MKYLKLTNYLVMPLILFCFSCNEENSEIFKHSDSGDDHKLSTVSIESFSNENDNQLMISYSTFNNGVKHGREEFYYVRDKKKSDLMGVQEYALGQKHGLSERYEMTTGNIISRCDYRNGLIWSGAALTDGLTIDPIFVEVKDLPYRVVIFEKGVKIREEFSSVYFGN